MGRPIIRNVVLDIGGVLIDWDPRHLYRHLIDDVDELERFLAEICTMEWNATLDAGRPFHDACVELAREHPEWGDLIHAWARQDEMVAGEVAGMRDVVTALRAGGVPVYLLTNMPVDVFEARQARFAVLRQVDGAVISGAEGVLKPSRAIFQRLVDRYGLVPEETLFVDDLEANVAGARAAGFQTHHFTGAALLTAALTDRGLL